MPRNISELINSMSSGHFEVGNFTESEEMPLIKEAIMCMFVNRNESECIHPVKNDDNLFMISEMDNYHLRFETLKMLTR